jgi:hypothetical protein
VVRVVADGPGELRGQDDLVAPALESASEDLLRVAVRVGGVDEVDAGVRARVTIASTSFWSLVPKELNIMAPRAKGETRMPVRPRGR